jgi:hypothetical protein
MTKKKKTIEILERVGLELVFFSHMNLEDKDNNWNS